MRWGLVLLLCLCGPSALAADGAKLFDDQCASCHTLATASNDLAPTLKGVVWRKVASRPDFNYSGVLTTLGGSWSPERLDSYLKDSQRFAPGNGMYFTVEDEADRKAIIEYLRAPPEGH